MLFRCGGTNPGERERERERERESEFVLWAGGGGGLGYAEPSMEPVLWRLRQEDCELEVNKILSLPTKKESFRIFIKNTNVQPPFQTP
jgi:hypothetical protein